MTEYGDGVPGYRTIRVGVPQAPVADLADLAAWQARDPYPDLLSAGHPVFGLAREREEGGWELHPYFGAPMPQGARESMAMEFRRLAAEAGRAGDRAGRAECLRAAERLDGEKIDETTVLGARYRVVRAERFIRSGPDGPEPPRSTDPDPAPAGRADRAHDPAAGFVIDPTVPTGVSEAILKAELLALVRAAGTAPPPVLRDSRLAARTHPGGVLLPAAFMVAECVGGRWAPESSLDATTPQGARDGLALALRVLDPVRRGLSAAERGQYARAADRLDRERGCDLRVADRLLRVVRTERLVRIGPDGPEGPRSSDFDPDLPVLELDRRLRARGGDPDAESPEPPDEATRELARLFRREERRRREQPGRR
ncbi:DUF5954 family protein [Kitasatospora sp. NPDC057015]|uniref:DUF5954 family protein n=1 Tax=Kitasatospora sp. NPDC057015 TaxID=3346001 RepID=UPI003630BB1B